MPDNTVLKGLCVICKTFRLCGIRHEPLMKLNQDDVERIVKRVVDYGLSTGFVARQFGITRRRVQQLVKHYRETGEVPVLRRPERKPYAKHPENLRDEVLWAKAKLKCSATGTAARTRGKV